MWEEYMEMFGGWDRNMAGPWKSAAERVSCIQNAIRTGIPIKQVPFPEKHESEKNPYEVDKKLGGWGPALYDYWEAFHEKYPMPFFGAHEESALMQ